MELRVDGGGEGKESEGEEEEGGRGASHEKGGGGGAGRKVKIHFETHFQLGVHKLLSQVSQNGGP